MKLTDLRYAGANFLRTMWAALAIWGILSLGLSAVGQVVVAMGPRADSWCKGPGYVQAHFDGYKMRDWWPVAGSFGGQVDTGHEIIDVPFQFVADPTPASSKPTGWQSFGIWRWYDVAPEAVRLTMRHTNGDHETISAYGFYTVPAELPYCP